MTHTIPPSPPPHRIGVLVPSTDTTLEFELPLYADFPASFHFTRMRLADVTLEGLQAMASAALDGAELLRDVEPDVVLYGCTSGSFFRGREHERELARELATCSHAPVVTTAWAVAMALRTYGRRVRLRTPYSDELTELEADYLREFDLEATSAAGLGIVRDRDVAAQRPATIQALAAGHDEADVLLLSCTNLPSYAIMRDLEEVIGLPVVTSNSASARALAGVLAGRLEPLARPADRKVW